MDIMACVLYISHLGEIQMLKCQRGSFMAGTFDSENKIQQGRQKILYLKK